MRLRWTPAAAADLKQISDYLRESRPQFRQATLRKIYERARALRVWPYLGRPGGEPNTRELLFPPLPYVIVYRTTNQVIEVIRVYHGAQQR